MKKAYYNEFDPYAAAWLRNLISAGEIPAGDVDERSIADVQPDDLTGYIQCHFFAGIGGWPLALRLAGWGDDRCIWTGSCPCPPFSTAGKKKLCPECGGRPIPHPLKTGIFACVPCGHEWHADARHLWPEFYRLIRERKPPAVAGEQVAGGDGLIWLAGVRATLEALGYDFGAADLCAASVCAPHIRQRLFWLADAQRADARRGDARIEGHAGSGRDRPAIDGVTDRLEHAALDGRDERRAEPIWRGAAGGCGSSGMALPDGAEFRGESPAGEQSQHERNDGAGDQSRDDGMGKPVVAGLEGHARHGADGDEPGRLGADAGRPVAAAGAWSDYRIIPCRDGKARRISAQRGDEPLAYGLPRKLGPGFAGLDRVGIRAARANRVGRLKGYGNAIVPEVAAEFLRAYMTQ